MKREQTKARVIELGTASTATLGSAIVGNPEPQHFYTLGLSDQ